MIRWWTCCRDGPGTNALPILVSFPFFSHKFTPHYGRHVTGSCLLGWLLFVSGTAPCSVQSYSYSGGDARIYSFFSGSPENARHGNHTQAYRFSHLFSYDRFSLASFRSLSTIYATFLPGTRISYLVYSEINVSVPDKTLHTYFFLIRNF